MVTSERYCKDCGKDISNLQPQCTRCSQCQKLYREFLKRAAALKKAKGLYAVETTLGTTDFNSHLKRHHDGTPDFKEEAKIIKREMKKLGLRR